MLSAEKVANAGGATALIYSAPISDKIVMAHYTTTMMFPLTFALCHSKELQKASYVHLYADRLEWSFASGCCLQISDNPNVLYLDRDVAELQTMPDCCRPQCTHCTCCPTFWDVSGEVLMLHGMNHCCVVPGAKQSMYSLCPMGGCPQLLIGKPMPCLNRAWVYIPYLDDALKLKAEILKVRTQLVKEGKAQQLTGVAAAEQDRQ